MSSGKVLTSLLDREELVKKSELSLTLPMKSKSQKISYLKFVFNACFSLTSFNKALVDKYLDIPYVEVSKPLKLTSTSFSFNSCRPNADTLAVTS